MLLLMTLLKINNACKKDSLVIIDDDTQALNKFKKIFNSSFIVHTAGHGKRGLELFHEVNPAIVLCDVKMPGRLSGIDVCREIKSHNPQTIVILFSVYNDTAIRLQGLESRADDYIDKLTSDTEIFYRVTNFYHTQRNHCANLPETYDDVEIDNFENRVKSIFTEYYSTPPHKREYTQLQLVFLEKKLCRERRTIQRDFKQKTNRSFREFHKEFRASLASEWLINTNKPIATIAKALNYHSPSHFSKCFKEKRGITPSQYRLDYNK